MSPLSRKIADALDGGTNNWPLSVAESPHVATIDLTSASPAGVAFNRLDFAIEGAAERSIDALTDWGNRLAARLTYLMETLVVLETDPLGGEVELRSRTPTPRGGKRSYYELRLRRDASLSLVRVAYDESTRRRETIPCQLTREALDRLVDDLVALAG
jgi:hypothetical protein